MLKGFPSLSKLSNRYLLWMQHLAKEGHEVGAGLKPAPTVFCALCVLCGLTLRRLMLVPNCVEYFLRRDRNIKQPDAAGVVHGVGNRGRRADVGMLTDAFCLVRPRPTF